MTKKHPIQNDPKKGIQAHNVPTDDVENDNGKN